MSVRQGAEISDILRASGLPWNQVWNGGAVVVPASGPLPTVELRGELRITVLAPAERDLGQLAQRWDEEMRKLGPRFRATDSRDPDDVAEEEEAPEEPAVAETGPAPRPDVYISCAHDDVDWAERLSKHLLAEQLNVFFDRSADPGVDRSAEIEAVIGEAAAAVVMVSADYLASSFAREIELPALIDRAKSGEMRLFWVLLGPAPWQDSGLADFQAAHAVDRPLATLDPAEQEEALASIVSTLAEPARSAGPSRGGRAAPSADVQYLADAPFTPDSSVANASSMAFLVEFQARSTLVGGDAHPATLEHSIRRLLEERGMDRLRVDAFVVPHNGSRGNLSRELLEVVVADRYLISTDGARFRHPHPETIARIIAYGRTSPEARPTLVFNYRAESNEMWDDPELQQRYGYDVVYAGSDPGGIRIDLA